MSTPLLLQSRQGPVVELTLNRPDSMNALNRALIAELTAAFRAAAHDDNLRAIVLTGAGRAFCAGVDLKELSASQDVANQLTWHGEESLFDVMRACPHPIVGAVNGFAVTGGLELAMMCDFLIASVSARFADTHAHVGITPSWGMTQVLPRLIGINRARQMSLTGDFIDAQTACDWGLVTETAKPDALMPRARELAARIAETDRDTLIKIRGLIGESAETSLAEGLRREAALFDRHITGVAPDKVADARAQVTAKGRAANTGKET